MKQTLEEAAKENILFNHRTVDRNLSGKDLAKFGEINFIQGAEWKEKQSPWISVECKYPSYDKSSSLNKRERYIVRVISGSAKQDITYTLAWLTGRNRFNVEMDWVKVTHWMPIPSFEDTLEANRDVLERIKNKGD